MLSRRAPPDGSDCKPIGARVFVYDLPPEFRDKAHYDCATRDCAYGGPPKLVRNVEQWDSGQYNLPWMLFDRVKTSPSRTMNVNEADLFFVPAWARSKRDCIPPARLWAALVAQNPRLLTEGRNIAVRHLLVDLHNTLVCPFMMDEVSKPAKWFTRVSAPAFSRAQPHAPPRCRARTSLTAACRISRQTNLEVDEPSWHLAFDRRRKQYVDPDSCTDKQFCRRKPWYWYAFPFPTAYHGFPASCPARTRPRGYSRYLWSHVVGNHGTAVPLRAALAAECQASKRCLGWDATAEQDNKLRKGVPKSRGVTHRFNDTKLVEFHMDSTFCAEVKAPTFEPVHAMARARYSLPA